MLLKKAKIYVMDPWEVIEEALAHKRPPQKAQWLADRLGITAQVITNWKLRGKVPPARYRQIAEALGLTVDQLEHKAPLPWEKNTGWPFPQIEQSRFDRLEDWQRIEIQGKVREMIDKFESSSGKSTGFQTDANRRSNGR